jgi:hypothetical protein
MLAPLVLVQALPLAISPASRPVPPAAAIEAPIVSVGLFKNGYCTVRRRALLPAAGSFELACLPEPVHGTLWIESEGRVEALVRQREIEVPASSLLGQDFQSELSGCEITLHPRLEHLAVVRGRVADLGPQQSSRSPRRAFEPSPQPWSPWYEFPHAPASAAAPVSRFLAVDTPSGRVYVETATIAMLALSSPLPPRREQRSVLEIRALEADGPLAVDIVYLTKGLSFAPSLHLDIGDPERMRIALSAVLRNELEDVLEADFRLIFGFPSIEFGGVLSPLAASTSWAAFFRELSAPARGSQGRQVLTQQVLSNFAPQDDLGGLGVPIPMAEGVDLHHLSLGTRKLAEGEAAWILVDSAEAPYQRIVEWRIPDTRDEHGAPRPRAVRGGTATEDEGPWDALYFANPFAFPLTTSPATVVAGDRFQGQHLSSWVSAGEATTLRITKALSIRTRLAEHEAEGEREFVSWGGRRYRRVAVRGEVEIANHRREAVSAWIRREFSGELESADAGPSTRLLESGAFAVNRRQELVWKLELGPGEERRLEYLYTVLVPH